MLGKLIKHEIKAVYKVFLGLTVIQVMLGILHVLSAYQYEDYNTHFFFDTTFNILLYMPMVYTIYAIIRFHKSLLGIEGYLLHTLPVKFKSLLFTNWLVSFLCIFFLTFFQQLAIEWESPYRQIRSFSLLQLQMYIQILIAFSLAITIGYLLFKNKRIATFFICVCFVPVFLYSNNFNNGRYSYFFIPVSKALFMVLPYITMIIFFYIISSIFNRKLNLE